MSDLVLGGVRYRGFVDVEEQGLGMITLRGDCNARAIKAAVKQVSGAAFPDMRGASIKGDHGALWMSPDEVMVLCPRQAAPQMARDLDAALAGAHALVADVSDARAAFRLTGPVRDVLAKLSPADLRPKSLPVGEVKRTRIAQVAAAFWLSAEEEAHLICFRSVAQYVYDLLKTSADPAARINLHH